MAEAVLYGIANEVLKNMGSTAIDELSSAWGFKSQLNKLKNTIETLKDVMLDAEERQADSHAVGGWLERLTTAVYAADDLFDEFATLASRKQLLSGNKVTKEVYTFFSYSNQITLAFKISHKIRRIRQELDDIVKDGTQFSFVFRPHEDGREINTSTRRKETYSFVDSEEVIGRDDDKRAILDLALASSSIDKEEKGVPVIPIVGIGGLGKTSLAQLIYNDPKIQDFFELRIWVCVSDVFDIKEITEKILTSATKTEMHQKLEMEQLQGQLRKEIDDKRYLLVLDDVWNENRDEWLKLRALLKAGRKGSKIIVTTRSREVAEIMGSFAPYELQGLSEEKSWDLFEKMAFKSGQPQPQCEPHLVKIGREIVRKCANVPLAIRALGSLLYGKSESKWLTIKDTNLAKLSENQNNIMNILKLSYHYLWFPLKNCFAYCALFPKDYVLDKETLINLWIAEGFIIPDANESQSLDEIADEYFLTLFQRCFFQDVIRDEWGAIKSCKMHDLMHDLAQQVAGDKCKVANFSESKFDDKINHLSFAYRLTSSWKIQAGMLHLKLLRTFLMPEQMKDGSPFRKSVCKQIISRFSRLRVLDLHNLGVESLPSSIGKLIHLRYLDLSKIPIKELPHSITELQNLQTLKLYHCSRLRALPTNMRKLTNLRSLNVDRCYELSHMPSRIGELTSLHTLPLFIVGNTHSQKSWFKCTSATFSDLKKLRNLKSVLCIQVKGDLKIIMSEAAEANLSCKHGLTELNIEFHHSLSYGDHSNFEVVLEGLRPHPNLRKLEVSGYKGSKSPSWVAMDNMCMSLPNLVDIQLFKWDFCQEVPTFSRLPFLKRLSLIQLGNLEYMESAIFDLSSSSSTNPLFFPSLQELTLKDMRNLKGWWKEGTSAISISSLSRLSINNCPKLLFLPLCPNVEDLTLVSSVLKMATISDCTSLLSSESEFGFGFKLKKLEIDDVEDLISLPKQTVHQLSSLLVQGGIKLQSSDSSEKLEQAFANLSSSLRSLAFYNCTNLKYISKGLEHLTALENLVLYNCIDSELSRNEPDDDCGCGMPWKTFKTSLRSVKLMWMSQLVSLPTGLQYLENLRSLELYCNYWLMEIPEWISCFSFLTYMELCNSCHVKTLPESFTNLTALNELRIVLCSPLAKRCQAPHGVDWPKIQHIPLVTILSTGRDGW
ncbi:putative disease resistance protein RGA4 [Bienertia sinuspersici]